jgi:hypothetical protein
MFLMTGDGRSYFSRGKIRKNGAIIASDRNFSKFGRAIANVYGSTVLTAVNAGKDWKQPHLKRWIWRTLTTCFNGLRIEDVSVNTASPP